MSAFTQTSGLFDVASTGSASTSTVSLNGGTAQVDGNLTASTSLSATGTGTFSGAGTITGNVSSSGITQAGNIPNPGILTINGAGAGTYTQASTGSYDVVIGGLTPGTQYSQLNATGAANLSGTLNVTLINSFVPSSGNQFTILTGGTLAGQFLTTNLPTLPPNLIWAVNYTSTSVVLSVTSPVSTYTLTVTTLGTGNGTVTDNFSLINCTDTAGVQSGTCSATYNSGTTVNLTATAVSPATFGGWGGACTGTGACSVVMNSAQSVTASFVPLPVTQPVTFSCPGGVYPCSNVTPPPAVFNCPSGTNPCTDPNAHSLALTSTTVNSEFTMTVAANEVPMLQADGDCESGHTPATDFDCRFTSYFPYETLGDGDVIVPICDAYSNGNCVFYSVYFGTRGIEPPTTDYAGPISWSIAWNNASFLPPPTYPYQINNPRLYDDPDYEVSTTTPYGTNCNSPMLINGNPTNPPIYCQFIFDITTYYDPNQPPDAGIGGKTKQFNDVVVAFPLTIASPSLSITKTADATQVNSGSPIGYTIAVSNSSAPGTGTATNAVINDPLPAGANINWTISPAYSGIGTCSITGSAPAQTLSCALGSMSPAISASVHVTSTNSSAGTYVNTATLSADNSSPLTSSATITVVNSTGPIATLTPSTLNFGNVYLGMPLERIVTLSNTGGTAMTVSNIKISGPGNDLAGFIEVSSCPKTLSAGRSCQIAVTCLATKDNYSPTATLAVTDNAPGSPQSVPLSATVINPMISLSPNTLNFGDQKVGTTSVGKRITLSNSGTTSAVLSSVTISGNFAFGALTTCKTGTTLAPASTCVMQVTFTPTEKGTRSGSVIIKESALGQKQEVTLRGTGD